MCSLVKIMMSNLLLCEISHSEYIDVYRTQISEENMRNMLSVSLENSFEINVESKYLVMTRSWIAGIKDDGTL